MMVSHFATLPPPTWNVVAHQCRSGGHWRMKRRDGLHLKATRSPRPGEVESHGALADRGILLYSTMSLRKWYIWTPSSPTPSPSSDMDQREASRCILTLLPLIWPKQAVSLELDSLLFGPEHHIAASGELDI